MLRLPPMIAAIHARGSRAWLMSAALAVSLAIGAAPACAQAPSKPAVHAEFAGFWADFRAAVLANDAAAVAALTRFPFTTRGPLDRDPVQRHDAAAFGRLLQRLLNQDPGLTREPQTMTDLIRRTANVSAGNVQGNQARVGQFVFEKVDGTWMFTQAYIEP